MMVECIKLVSRCSNLLRGSSLSRCEALIPYRKMLDTRGWDSGSEPDYGIKTSSIMVVEVVAVVIRQCALNNCLW